MKPSRTTNIQIRLPLNCQIKIRSSLGKNSLWLLKFIFQIREKKALGVFSTSLVKVSKNASQTKGKNSSQTSNWSVEGPVSPQLLIACSVSFFRPISVVTVPRWKFLLLTKKLKDLFPAGSELLSCHQCVFSINGSSHEKNTNKMGSCKWRKGSDDSHIYGKNYWYKISIQWLYLLQRKRRFHLNNADVCGLLCF